MKKWWKVDREYCSVRFIRMLKTINIIHDIQKSDEFRDFYDWLRDFYQVEISEFIGDVCGEFELKEGNSLNTLDFKKTVQGYVFDCLQYGRNKINQGAEACLINHLSNDLFVKEMDELRLKFKKKLSEDEQLKEAYIKLTEHIDIRYLVLYRFNAEHLFLTWISIENYFSSLNQRTTRLNHDEYLKGQKFQKKIYEYLHDFEILAKNKGYEIGHVSIADLALFTGEAVNKDYLTFRLAEDFKVPVVDALLDYLEFAKFKLHDTAASINAPNSNNPRLEQLHRIIQILNAEKSKKASQKGAGVFTLLCYTVYKLRGYDVAAQSFENESELKKGFLDYLANLLQLVGVHYSYNATVKAKSNLKLTIYFTASAIQEDLFALYFEFYSKISTSPKLSDDKINVETGLLEPSFVDLVTNFDLNKEVNQNVSFNRGIKLCSINVNQLNTKISDEKGKAFSFASLYMVK